jgi:AraC family transcriptional activator of pobA
MQATSTKPSIPVYPMDPDESTGSTNFRVTTFEGSFPNQSDLLIPHRKAHYLIVFVRHAPTRQWIDTQPYTLKDNTIYFTGPSQVIVKEEFKQLWSTGIAFTAEFLQRQENATLNKLPLIQNPHNAHELLLTPADVLFTEDMIQKIRAENSRPGEWQQRMLLAYLTVLLTHLSRLYTEQFKGGDGSADKQLLKKFQATIDEHFQQLHEVNDYASLLHISPGHLSEVVKSQSGKPAIKHIHDRLVMEARRLLFHTDNSLKDISFDLGFSDASYFNRFFKRETGATPAGYRTDIRKMYH